jgi:hypothetical protein
MTYLMNKDPIVTGLRSIHIIRCMGAYIGKNLRKLLRQALAVWVEEGTYIHPDAEQLRLMKQRESNFFQIFSNSRPQREQLFK